MLQKSLRGTDESQEQSWFGSTWKIGFMNTNIQTTGLLVGNN